MRPLLVLLLFAVGCGPVGSSVSDVDYKSTAASAITLAMFRKVSPDNPSPTPNGKCQDCGGKGKVGDGRIMVDCKTCGGDGVVGQMPDEIVDVVPGVPESQPVDSVDPPSDTACVCAAGCENGACSKCNDACPNCVTASQASAPVEQNCANGQCSPASGYSQQYYAPRLFGRWRR